MEVFDRASAWSLLYNFGSDRVEDTSSNGSSTVACPFDAADTCSPRCCLEIIVFLARYSVFQASYQNVLCLIYSKQNVLL
jgi:hypothetical protein